MEVEAKFSVPDRATFDRLSRLEELAGYRLDAASVKQVRDRYLDTDDRAILRAGYACRVRARGEEHIATLKGLGGTEAGGAIHHRAEYEMAVGGDDPATWPESSVRDLTLEFSAGRPLHELFSLQQERHLRLLYVDAPGGARRVAELSLDVVTPGLPNSHPYFELEIELLEQGSEADLRILVQELRQTWSLRPELRSKFERGLELLSVVPRGDQGERPMEKALTADERVALQTWIETGNRPEQRRARIVLLHDQGLSSSTIAAEVGLSARQVRRWLAAFREHHMGIFPAHVEGEQAVEKTGAIESAGPATTAPVTVEELCASNGVNMERAAYVRDLAVQLFDLTLDVHRLSPRRRFLLEVAATLHNLGLAQDPPRHHLVGRDLILAQPIAGLEGPERDMLASVVAFHRKKVRRRGEHAFMRLPDLLQQETLALAALLRMATGLDSTETQSTRINRVEPRNGRLIVVVEGPVAMKDGEAARRRSKLWEQLFATSVDFFTVEQMRQTPSVIEFGSGLVPLPGLTSPGLLPDDPMSEAGRKSLWFHFIHMLQHEPGTRAGEDIEELHDMRVATRRMRAAIRVFGDFFEPAAIKPFNRGLRRVTRALGPVRDLDVFEEKAGRYLEMLPEAARSGLDPLIESWHAERVSSREEMLAFLDSQFYHEFKRDFGEFLQTAGAGARPIPRDRPEPYQVRHVAPRLIYTRYETVRAYETVLQEAQIETLHALRIDCKYLRYTLEFLREVLGHEAEAVIGEVKAMQDHLGDLNDAEVAIGLLSDFLSDWDARQADVPLAERRSGEGIVTYLASRHAEKHRLLVTFPEAWNRLNREEVRRWLALAVAAL